MNVASLRRIRVNGANNPRGTRRSNCRWRGRGDQLERRFASPKALPWSRHCPPCAFAQHTWTLPRSVPRDSCTHASIASGIPSRTSGIARAGAVTGDSQEPARLWGILPALERRRSGSPYLDRLEADCSRL